MATAPGAKVADKQNPLTIGLFCPTLMQYLQPWILQNRRYVDERKSQRAKNREDS
jgi:hypothetical protein